MVCDEPKKWPPGSISPIAATDSDWASASSGSRTSTIIWIISASTTAFSNDAVSPPSSQPAP